MMDHTELPQIHTPEPHRKPLSFLHPAYLLATWFGCGKIPFMPGTWGSLGALPFAYIIHINAGAHTLLLAALVAFIAGIAATKIYMTANNTPHDSSEIVIDEVAAQWLLLSALPPTFTAYAIGFITFRIFDILKPWPINLLDEHVPGAFGVMIDDFAAGAIPALLFLIFIYICTLTGHNDIADRLYWFLGTDHD
jgi:phosphatidylglycerophosphatase A